MTDDHAYTDEEISAEADELMRRLGLPVDRRTDIWRSLRLGISRGIGMGIDAVVLLLSRKL